MGLSNAGHDRGAQHRELRIRGNVSVYAAHQGDRLADDSRRFTVSLDDRLIAVRSGVGSALGGARHYDRYDNLRHYEVGSSIFALIPFVPRVKLGTDLASYDMS
jgi:hypothetical protein